MTPKTPKTLYNQAPRSKTCYFAETNLLLNLTLSHTQQLITSLYLPALTGQPTAEPEVRRPSPVLTHPQSLSLGAELESDSNQNLW